MSRYTCYNPTHTLGSERVSRCSVDSRGSCTRQLGRRRRANPSASVASSCPPAPPRPSTHRQLSAHRPARLRHLKPTSLANLFASSETCIRSPMFFSTCGENCSFFKMMYGFPSDSSSTVLSSPRSMIVTFLSSATSPCKRQTHAPLLRMFTLRWSPLRLVWLSPKSEN